MAAAGTLTLTQNSTTVTGSGTAFTTALAAGGFIVATVGGTTHTLGIESIENNTSLTLSVAYNGPTTSGVAFDYVPLATLNLITSALAAQVTYALRAANLDRNNWQQIFSGTGNVTVMLPEGTSWTGPAWNGITTSLAAKLDKNQNLNDVADKATARTNMGWVDGFLPVSLGGTGAGTKANAWAALATFGNTAGTAAQGNDTRLNTLDGKSGGKVSSLINVKGDILSQTTFGDSTQGRWSSELRTVLDGWGKPNDAPSGVNGAFFGFATISPSSAGAPVQGQITGSSYWQGTKRWYFPFDTGNAIAPGTWVSNSDERIKTKIQRIDDPLGKMRLIKGVTWERLDNAAPGIGFIAQDVQAVFPDSVFVSGDRTLKDGTVVKDILSPDTSGVSAALHHEAILALMDRIDKQDAIITELQSRMKAIDGLDS